MTREEARDAIKKAVGSSGLMLIDEDGNLDMIWTGVKNVYVQNYANGLGKAIELIDKYKAESENKE